MDQIECVACHIPVKLEGAFTDFLSPEDAVRIAKFKEEMGKAHKEDCPFSIMTKGKHKLMLREKPPFYEYQTDYMDFTRASFYLAWEANLQENRASFLEAKELPLVDPEWTEKAFKPEDLELLWLDNKTERKKGEFDAAAILGLYGWKYEYLNQTPCLSCKYCLRKVCATIYASGPLIQTTERKEVDKSKYLFNPEKAHYTYCKWVHKSVKNNTGPEISLELLKARLDAATKAVNTARLLTGVYSDPQKYIEDRLKVASQIKQIYRENKSLYAVAEGAFAIKKDMRRLKDVDTLENEKFRKYMEKQLKEALDKNMAIKNKTEEIKAIVAVKRKRVEDILGAERQNKKAKNEENGKQEDVAKVISNP